MIEFGGKWFYKAKGVKTIDFMSLFFERRLNGPAIVPLRIFGTPVDGVNPKTDAPDWATNYYSELKSAPQLRIRYEVPGRVGLR